MNAKSMAFSYGGISTLPTVKLRGGSNCGEETRAGFTPALTGTALFQSPLSPEEESVSVRERFRAA
jgi:hypothetical protein